MAVFARLGRRLWLSLLGALLIAGTVGVGAQLTFASPGRHGRDHWVASWTASPEAAAPGTTLARGFGDQTIRNVVYTSAGGTMARVRLANTFGSRPLEIGRAAVAVAGAGAAVAGSVPLHFSGHTSVVIPAGGQVISDPVHFAVRPQELLAVSLFLPRATGAPTEHVKALQTNYLADGNHVLADGPAAFGTQTQSWYFLTGLDVWSSPSELGAVVALGDSITNGHGSRTNANARWPNDLARRLGAVNGATLSAVDAGIEGNRVLNHAPCCGPSALARFGPDVLQQAGVKDVIVLEGNNDITYSDNTSPLTVPHTNVTAAQIIAGYQELIARAHAAGLKIFAATLTPFRGSAHWTPAGEAKREAVNAWIRTSGAFNGVIDFARVLADPSDPEMLDPRYDSGDHLHPNDAGYQAMADAINIKLLLQ